MGKSEFSPDFISRFLFLGEFFSKTLLFDAHEILNELINNSKLDIGWEIKTKNLNFLFGFVYGDFLYTYQITNISKIAYQPEIKEIYIHRSLLSETNIDNHYLFIFELGCNGALSRERNFTFWIFLSSLTIANIKTPSDRTFRNHMTNVIISLFRRFGVRWYQHNCTSCTCLTKMGR